MHLSLSGKHVQVESIVGSREYEIKIILEGGCWGGVKAVVNDWAEVIVWKWCEGEAWGVWCVGLNEWQWVGGSRGYSSQGSNQTNKN